MAVDPHPLRVFLQAIVTGRPSSIPEDLRGLARGVLGRRAGPAEVDDLLGEFLLRLVEATRRSRAGSAVALLQLSDTAIRASIRHRLRQVLAETCPGARPRKQLRAMVKAVLAHDLAEPPACAPNTLYRGDRLCAALVRDAVAWMHAQDDRPARTVQVVAARLHDLYFGGDQHRDEPVQASFEDEVLRGLDAPQLALDLHHHLGPDLRRVAGLRAGGAELKTIAEDQQVAVSTAHQRVATAVKRIREHARRRRVGPSTLEPMLLALGR
jgi:DNA-directed RNA polymerase specialized sigma24 family protein